MKKFKKKSSKTTEPTAQQMPIVTFTQLKDLFGPESWLLFKLINE